jgi:FKBP-type peptidyl-prolyl cis-trans isomerase FklB
MNLKWLPIVILFSAAPIAMAQNQPSITETQKLSYKAGVEAGKKFLDLKKKDEIGFDLDIDLVAKGVQDAYKGAKLLVSEDELKIIETKWTKEKQKSLADENKMKAEAFLKTNKEKPDVLTLPGTRQPLVQYRILDEGGGPKPKETDTVVVNFKGRQLNGKEFANTFKSGKTLEWPIGKLPMQGLKTALVNMPIGAKWEVVIPPEQAYGEDGDSTKVIEPNALLICEIELQGIVPPQEPKTPNQ